MARANILKLLRFDEDIRDSVTQGRRLRNCALIVPPSIVHLAANGACFVGVDFVCGNTGPVVAAAVSLLCLNWGVGLKNQLEQLNREGRAGTSGTRNQLTETLCAETIWALDHVTEQQARVIGKSSAGRIVMLGAVERLVAKLAAPPETVVVIVDERRTISDLPFAQMSIANAADRSACVASANVVAQAFLDTTLKRLQTVAPLRHSVTAETAVENFGIPIKAQVQETIFGVPPELRTISPFS